MKYSKTPPTKEGWYWAKTKSSGSRKILVRFQSTTIDSKLHGCLDDTQGNRFIVSDPWFTHFAGPIPEPEE